MQRNIFKNVIALIIVAVASLAMTSSPVLATPIEYKFNGNSLGFSGTNLGNNVLVTSDGLSMTMIGYDAGGGAADISRQSQNGLGIRAGGDNKIQADEAIAFDFSGLSVMAIKGIVVEWGNTPGSANVYVDNVLTDTISWLGNNGGGNSGKTAVNHDFTSGAVGHAIKFQHPGNGGGDFRVRSLTVEQVEVSADVPEPTTATLALLGLGGLMMRRRRNA